MNLLASCNNEPEFLEVVGYSYSHHGWDEVGCFYTTALKVYMEVDVSFQNSGGIRAGIEQGAITKLKYTTWPPSTTKVLFSP